MFLTDDEKEAGYELQWKDRDSKVLTKSGRVLGVVIDRKTIDMAIESHETYLRILELNHSDSKGMSAIDKAHAAAFVIMILVVIAMTVVGSLE